MMGAWGQAGESHRWRHGLRGLSCRPDGSLAGNRRRAANQLRSRAVVVSVVPAGATPWALAADGECRAGPERRRE